MSNMLSNMWRKVGLELKLQILIQGFLLIVLITAQLWITARFEQQALNAAAVRAETLADGVIDGLNTMMVAKGKDDDVIRDEKIRSLYIEEIGAGPSIREVRVVRDKSVDKEFGEGLPQERPRDDMDLGVLASGKTATRVILGANGAAELRAVVPFIAEKTTRATNCVKCHEAEVGSAIGAASVTLDIKEDLASISRLNTMIWIGQAALQVMLFFVVGLIVRGLLRQLGGEPAYVIDIVTRIARGDLSGEVRTRSGDTSSLLAAMSGMQSALRSMISSAIDTAVQLHEAARGLVVSSHQVLSAAEREGDASASVAAAVEEMTVCIGQISENAGSAQHHATATGTLAKNGSTAMQDVIVEMDKISESVVSSSGVISALGDRSRQISAIVNVIKEIADQTNLLALNAAIEAARAGEQGRGFAVVADEVRKLAERTSHSTTEIAAMVEAIQHGTADAVEGMANGSACVTSGLQRVDIAGDAMAKIQNGVQQVLASVDDISASLREQSVTSNLIAKNVEEFARMTDETSTVMRQVSGSADRLQQLATALKASVEQFRL